VVMAEAHADVAMGAEQSAPSPSAAFPCQVPTGRPRPAPPLSRRLLPSSRRSPLLFLLILLLGSQRRKRQVNLLLGN
jgi:hypothetical protein